MATTEPPTSPYVLQLLKVGRQYGSDPAVHALVDVDLRLKPGEWLAITGPSGSGKSTLLNVIGCLDTPTSGSYFFEGIDTATLSDNERAGLRSQRIGFVFQSFHLLPHRSVLENVMLAETYRRQSRQGRRERALAAIDKVGLGHRAEFLPTKLSGGEKQRVAIARAIMGAPGLLLCDEPTGNLDSKSSANILDIFADLNRQGYTLVVVTHDETISKRASRRVHIIDGKLTELANGESHGQQAPSPGANKKASTISRSGITLRDLFDEAIAGMFARPGRMALTMLGIVIGITALVATLGLSRTASNRILGQFDELAATEIVVTAKSGVSGAAPNAIPWDAPARLRRLNGVTSAGTLSPVDIGDALVSSSLVKDPQGQTAFNLSVQAASPGLFQAVRADLKTGRLPDLGHSTRADRVAVLGPGAALKLGIVSVRQLPAIAIGDKLYMVIGILRNVARQPDLLGSVIIPEGTARHDFRLPSPGSVIIETRIGAASLIAKQVPLALRPDNPAALKIASPPEPQRLKDAVKSDLNVLFLLLGGLSLIVGAIGIGNITLVSVIERTGEIGLRRSIGATRGHIAIQFLLESTSLGIIGGILGAGLGILIVVAVSAHQVWTPVLDAMVPFLAPLVGGSIGLLSGTYPALRAARLEPVEAFRN
ncbi:MAG: ATP-binding cassette domain-containing protein [Chloroflexi bacterium]|nr:ATP-binding cassette domain-containing protein [Chloroflexota bacterium]